MKNNGLLQFLNLGKKNDSFSSSSASYHPTSTKGEDRQPPGLAAYPMGGEREQGGGHLRSSASAVWNSLQAATVFSDTAQPSQKISPMESHQHT